MRRPSCFVAALGVTLALAGCGGSHQTTAATALSDGLKGTLTVFAASSLTESFGTLGKQFHAAHPGVTVRFNFGASSALAQSISQGAPADVFAAASAKTMATVVKTGDANAPKTFATNTMQIAVPPANPGKVTALADLAKPGLKIALCQVQVPCGATAQKVFIAAQLTVKASTFGADVKSVLTTVELGEVDAGVVFRTDVKAAGSKVRGIDIPAAQNASTGYPIATLAKAPNAAAAAAFEGYVLSAEGMKVLTAAGFSTP